MGEDTTVWERKAHTRVKHEILREYLNAWFPILGGKSSISRRLLFIDGFAGPGIYKNGEPGSPIVALQAIANATIDLSKCEFVFILVEEDKARAESLDREVERFRQANGTMPNVKTNVYNGTFAGVAQQILDHLKASGANLAPTFAMIDPFGFSGVPMSLITEFLRFPRCEIFFNFMLDSVNRHAQNTMVEEHMEQLFGCPDFTQAPPAGTPARQEFLTNLYARQLQSAAGFTHVSRFDLVNEKGRNNVLFHGTRHIKGLEVMRRAIWGFDSVKGERFDAREDPNIGTLFGGEVDLQPLQAQIVDRFRAQKDVSIQTIHEFVLTGTGYDPTRHLKKGALKVIEDAGGIVSVTKIDGKPRKKGTFPEDCRISFAS